MQYRKLFENFETYLHEHWHLLIKKMVYPYESLNLSWNNPWEQARERLRETTFYFNKRRLLLQNNAIFTKQKWKMKDQMKLITFLKEAMKI